MGRWKGDGKGKKGESVLGGTYLNNDRHLKAAGLAMMLMMMMMADDNDDDQPSSDTSFGDWPLLLCLIRVLYTQ